MPYSSAQRESMLKIFDAAKKKLGNSSNSQDYPFISAITSSDLTNESSEKLGAYLSDPKISAELASVGLNSHVLNNLLNEAGLNAVHQNKPSAMNGSSTTSLEGDIDLGTILKTVGIEGPLAAVIAHFMGGSAAKWGLGVGGGKMLLDWLNSDDGKLLISDLKNGFGTGADGVGGALGALMKGGGEFFKNTGGALGGIFDSPQIQHMLSMAKENPLATIALAVAAASSFGNGFSLGGVFSFCKTSLWLLAGAWVLENYMGVDLSANGRAQIIADAPSQTPPQLRADKVEAAEVGRI